MFCQLSSNIIKGFFNLFLRGGNTVHEDVLISGIKCNVTSLVNRSKISTGVHYIGNGVYILYFRNIGLPAEQPLASGKAPCTKGEHYQQ